MKKEKDSTVETIGKQYPELMVLVKEYLVPGIWLQIKEEYRQYFEMRDKLKRMIEEHGLDYNAVLKKVSDLEWEVKQLKGSIGKKILDSCKK